MTFMTSSFIFGDIQVENQNLSYFAEILSGGRIDRLITKIKAVLGMLRRSMIRKLEKIKTLQGFKKSCNKVKGKFAMVNTRNVL